MFSQLIKQQQQSEKGAAGSARRQQEPSPTGGSALLVAEDSLHADGVENTNRFTDKTENGFAESCLGYSKSQPCLGGWDSCNFLNLFFFFLLFLPEAGWLSDTDFFVQQ